MPIMLKEIPNALVEKKDHEHWCAWLQYGSSDPCDCRADDINQAIDAIGEKKIGLNRERLANIIWLAEKGERAPENEQVMIMEQCYRYADAILAIEGELLEVKG